MDRAFVAAMSGDAETLWRLMPVKERERLGWSRSQFEAYVAWTTDGFREFDSEAQPVREMSMRGHLGTSEWFLIGPDGRQASLRFTGYQDEGGPVVFSTMDLFLATAQARHLHEMKSGARTSRLWGSVERCLALHIDRLASEGLTGVVNTGPEFQLTRWTALRNTAERVRKRKPGSQPASSE